MVSEVINDINIQATKAPRVVHAAVRNQFEYTSQRCVFSLKPSDSFSWQGTCTAAVDTQIEMTIKIPAITIGDEMPGGRYHARRIALSASASIGGPTTIEVRNWCFRAYCGNCSNPTSENNG
jgi:hypothetical protein